MDTKADREWRRWYQRESGVPAIFRDKRLDSFDVVAPEQQAAVAAARDFMESFADKYLAGEQSALWFIGPPGTGKTRIASAIVTEMCLDLGLLAHITTPAKVIRRLRSTWSRASTETEDQVIRYFTNFDVLVLDDVGTGWGSDADAVQLTEVIDERYSKCYPTLITSNLGVESLREELGDRAFDRLSDGARVLPLTVQSYRRPA